MKPGVIVDIHLDSKLSLQEKLVEIYYEEMTRKPSMESLHGTSRLLSILVEREHLNTLIINLYPNNEGYSLMLRNASTIEEIETVRLAYEESDILEYIDNELIPPVIIDLLDRVQNKLFYSGNIIAELRDYRHLTDNLFETHYVLLKPSDHTMICDLNSMTSETKSWPMKDKLLLESEILLQTSNRLCLDPSPVVFSIASCASQYKTLQQRCLKRTIKRCSQVFLNRQKKLESLPSHVANFERLKKMQKLEVKNDAKSKDYLSHTQSWHSKITQPQQTDSNVFKCASVINQPKMTCDNGLTFVEEFVFEADRGNGKTNLSKLTILQRPSDEVYYGLLYVDRDFKDGESQGSSCRFNLGSYSNVEKYVRQFREIFTEEGRRQVKITHQVGNQTPLVTFTQTSASDNGTTSAMAIAPTSEDGRLKLPCSFSNEFTNHSQSVDIDAKPASSFVLLNSEPSNSFLPPNANSQVTWSEAVIAPSNQVASLFPIKLLPPVTLANMSPQLSQLFSPGNMNTSLLQINTSQLGCSPVFLSPTLDNTHQHGGLPQFLPSKPSIHPQTTVTTFLSPSLSLQSSNILKIPSQFVSQLQQQKPGSTQQTQLQQQLQQQRTSHLNVSSSFLAHVKDAKTK